MNRTQLVLSYLGAALAGLIIGFFAGREYLKYEIREGVTAAVSEIRTDIATAFKRAAAPPPIAVTPIPAPAAATPAESPKAASSPIELGFVSKKFTPADPQRQEYDDYINLSLTAKNVSGRDIRAINGVLRFTDLLDNERLATNLTIDTSVKRGETIQWQGSLKYNPFSEGLQWLRDIPGANIKIGFQPKKVLFADGTSQTWE